MAILVRAEQESTSLPLLMPLPEVCPEVLIPLAAE
jgi:hypothetical protein